ncbi:MAG: hypothetical protein BM564_01110 [Bacteroidetes bacterium MedPE-SWsnd-G2]|nr:MAG: hypothetical protein BM564_01110 [Bacteroidetes bacterium MedPE-SWsnd-G2]
MLTKKRYSPKEMIVWTRKETAIFLLYPIIIVFLYDVLGFTFLNVPWTPIALVGTAVAFIVGFQNNAAYGRIWEARKIWGGIVNTSRTWGMKVKDMVTNEYTDSPLTQEELNHEIKTLVFRHIAWLTTLRHAMRTRKPWEMFEKFSTNREWSRLLCIPERNIEVETDVKPYLKPSEIEYIMSKNNKSAALLYLQSSHIRNLKEQGLIWEFSFLELENVLQELFTLQGKSERIKNFPYPRQYATLSFDFIWIFLLLIPLGLVPLFDGYAENLAESFPIIHSYFIWIAVPFCAALSWIFHTMMRIGTVGENPFEGSANDVPISTIARGIEIDLRQLLDEDIESIPDQFPELYDIQM